MTIGSEVLRRQILLGADKIRKLAEFSDNTVRDLNIIEKMYVY